MNAIAGAGQGSQDSKIPFRSLTEVQGMHVFGSCATDFSGVLSGKRITSRTARAPIRTPLQNAIITNSGLTYYMETLASYSCSYTTIQNLWFQCVIFSLLNEIFSSRFYLCFCESSQILNFNFSKFTHHMAICIIFFFHRNSSILFYFS